MARKFKSKFSLACSYYSQGRVDRVDGAPSRVAEYWKKGTTQEMVHAYVAGFEGKELKDA